MNKICCLLIAGVAVLAVSCKKQSFLAPVSITDLTEQTVFADSAHTMDFLAQIYAGDDFSFNATRFGASGGSTGMSAACDEAEGSLISSDNTYLQFATASVTPTTVKDDAYSRPYVYFRAINQFLSHISTAKFSQAQRNRAKGEALFLRAWYYFIMMKHYGGVPIVGDKIYTPDETIPTVRSTFEQTVNYIIAQCDSAQKLLSPSYGQFDYGRATTGACMALKSRVLLYAASPLFNGSTIDPNNPDVGYPDYDKNRWLLAKNAAYAVIKTNAYALTGATDTSGKGFYLMGIHKVNPEFIFFKENGGLHLEGAWDPPSRNGISNLAGTYPYQELVDDFDMKNGKAITDPSSGYDPANPYANRDPRFNYTICHNLTRKAFWNGTILKDFEPIYTYVGSPTKDGIRTQQSATGTPTGYYVNKMLSDTASNQNILSGPDRADPLIRYAEILLNYAEAANEYSGPSDSIYLALKAIRMRAGIRAGSDGMYGLKAGMSQTEMRTAIQHERRVELAFEEHRFWDVRRWKIADATQGKMMTGMQIIRIGNSFTYQRINVRQHNFLTKNYLWPFPQHEISKPGGLTQNPGYPGYIPPTKTSVSTSSIRK